jgi:hypothetical protein
MGEMRARMMVIMAATVILAALTRSLRRRRSGRGTDPTGVQLLPLKPAHGTP